MFYLIFIPIVIIFIILYVFLLLSFDCDDYNGGGKDE